MTLIVDEAPWIFLYSEIELIGVRANVKDIIVQPIEGIIAKQAKID
jgi:ABC-type transport system substrate-binding protein